MGCSKKSGYLSDDIIGVGAGEASRLQIAPDLRLACRRLPVQEHPSAISFFRIHTILHDILGFDTIITRYTRYFKSVKNCVFFLKACSGDSRQLAKKRVNYIFLGTYPFQ